MTPLYKTWQLSGLAKIEVNNLYWLTKLNVQIAKLHG